MKPTTVAVIIGVLAVIVLFTAVIYGRFVLPPTP